MAITLDEANKMVAGAIAKAKELNIKINVAVVDAGGRLLAFNRMDGAIWGGMYGSQPAGVYVQAWDYAFGQHSQLVSPVVLGSSLQYNTVPGRVWAFHPIGVAGRLR